MIKQKFMSLTVAKNIVTEAFMTRPLDLLFSNLLSETQQKKRILRRNLKTIDGQFRDFALNYFNEGKLI